MIIIRKEKSLLAYQVCKQLSHVMCENGKALPLLDIKFHEHLIVFVFEPLHHVFIQVLDHCFLEVFVEFFGLV